MTVSNMVEFFKQVISVFWPALLFAFIAIKFKAIPPDFVMQNLKNPSRVHNGIRLNFGIKIDGNNWPTIKRNVILVSSSAAIVHLMLGLFIILSNSVSKTILIKKVCIVWCIVLGITVLASLHNSRRT